MSNMELEAVVAFLDSLGADVEPLELSSDVEGSVESARLTERTLHWKERGYSTMIVRRKRAELQTLREQARKLERQLEDVKWIRANVSAHRPPVDEEQAARVEIELRARQEAEAINQQLRSRLAQLNRLREDVGRAIAMHQERERTFGELCGDIRTSAGLSRAVALNDSSRMLETMLGETDALFSSVPPHPLDATSSCSLVSVEKQGRGEVRSTTATRCSVENASSLLWGKPPGDHPPPLVNDETADGNAYRRAMFLTLHTRRAPRVKLLLEHFGRRVHDPVTGHIVLVVFALIRVPDVSSDVLLWEQFWTRISPTNDFGSSGSVTHWCYRIHACSARSAESQLLQDSVKHSLVLLTRQYAAVHQNRLLDAASPALTV